MNLYRDESSYPLPNAQRNLMGRTHYVDPDTLRFHKSRVLSSHVVDQGLLFAIVESCALDWENRKRGFRYCIWDVFGNSIERPTLDETFTSRKAATKAMWKALNELDAIGITLGAISRAEHNHAQEMAQMRAELAKIAGKQKAAA